MDTRDKGMNGRRRNRRVDARPDRGQPRTRVPERIIHVVALVALGYGIYYLGWRISTFNPQAMWFSWVLWAAELFGFITLALLALMTWRLVRPTPPCPKAGARVDIYVPTFNEPVDILRETLMGCSQVRYPHRTYLLDDGNRPEMRELAKSVGCEYIARPTHEGAKAGNINHALRRTRGEFIVVLDADFVPLPDLLDTTLGFFEDPKVAVVQGPQAFFNTDSFQHSPQGWHEQQMFFDAVQPGKNRTKSAFWCGCPSVLRRSALESLGGVVAETVTEDLHTSLRLASKGYHTVYIDRPIAYGLAPPNAEEFLAQRFRWAQGTMQVLRRDNPLLIPGLTWSQRLSFLASMITYFEGPQRLVFFSIPFVALIIGILPIRNPGLEFWMHFIPSLILNQASAILLSRGSYNLWNVELYSTIKAFSFTSSILTLFTGRARPFRVSNKDVQSGTALPWRHVAPHLVTVGLCLCAMGIGVFHMFHPLWYELPIGAIAASLLWTAVVLSLLLGAVIQFRRSTRRGRFRFPIGVDIMWSLAGEGLWHTAKSIDLSASGLQFSHSEPKLVVGDRIEVVLQPPRGGTEAEGENERSRPSESPAPIIGLQGTVAANHPVPARTEQYIGLQIREFTTETDSNRYAHFLHAQQGRQ